MRWFLAPCIVALAFGSPARAQTCSSTFIRATSYLTRDYARDVALGDFTNDGKVDAIVASNYQGGSLEVLPGNGDGTFGASIATGSNTFDGKLAIGFFNDDSNLDVAVADSFSIAVLLGNGNGTFQPPNLYGNNSFISSLIAVDVDDNGRVDLVTGTSGGIVVFLGDGFGGFAAGVTYPTPDGAQARSVAAGRFDIDGNVALVAALDNNTVAIFPGNGDGTFGAPTSIPVGPDLRQVVVADLSSDGDLDLAVSFPTAIAILKGNGDGTFQAAVELLIAETPIDFVAGDFDEDGRTDLAGLGNNSGVVALFLQHSDGSFVEGPAYLVRPFGSAIAAADLDGNGGLDFTASGYGLTVVLSAGGSTYVGTTAIPPKFTLSTVAAGDFRTGGSDEIVTLETDFDGTGEVFGWTPGAGFERIAEFLAPRGAVSSANGDFDGDGNLDLAVATSSNGLLVLRGNGDGSFQPSDVYFIPGQIFAVVSGDFGGDGKPDLAVTDTAVNPGEISLLVNNGDGTFASPIPFALEHFPTGLSSADLNADGHPDLVVSDGGCCAPVDAVSILLGDGNGGFLPPTDYPTGPVPVAAVAGLFDEDGFVDLVVANSGGSSMSLLLGNGTGGFAAPTLIAIGWVPASIAAADFNQDGNLDVVTANTNGSNVSLLLGNGQGQFQAPASYLTGFSPFALAVGRFDEGTGTDVAVANPSPFLTVLLNAALSATVADESVIVGSAAVLEASASGSGALIYQWRKDGVPLADGGPISGSQTATLTIDPVAFTDAGSYDVVVTDSCTNVTSNAATLAVEFDDVPLSNPFHNDILTIATLGITGGCNTGTSYCPSNPVSRAEMAVFLLKAKFGAGHVPPPPPPVPTFADVPANAFAAAWIEELASLGVTGGCGNGLYCPDASVTRAEMAVFLLKTLLGSAYTPPDPAGIFADVPPSNFAIAWIEDLYNRGVTAGCATNPLRYCPDTAVPREQMATFLVRTFQLP